MTRPRHGKRDVERARQYAEEHGWRVKKASGHAWGRLICPWNDPDCRCGEFCIVSVWSTPRNPENHARQIRRVVDRCRGGLTTEEAPDD